MKNEEIKNIQSDDTFQILLQQLEFDVDDLDYAKLEQRKPILQQLAETSNSVISVYDLYQKKHVFSSSNIGKPLGFSSSEIEENPDFPDYIIHPDDYSAMNRKALILLKLYSEFSLDEKMNFKFINEFRVLNAYKKYVRVIEQQQILELDAKGNIWLIMSILDVSPNQKNLEEGVKSELLNFRTGKIIPLDDFQDKASTTLSKREVEILKLVKDGLLSKEISDKLSISLHTVNTLRQRVLAKLGANNSMEAVMLASKLGLV